LRLGSFERRVNRVCHRLLLNFITEIRKRQAVCA
jgi:hypothetical protein